MGDWVALHEYAQKRGISEKDVFELVETGELLHRQLSGKSYVYDRGERPPGALALAPPSVPMHYAERAMGTIMQLHGELMAEKERCIDLQRRLLSRDQTVAELEWYVRILEARLEGRFPEVPRPEPLAKVTPIRPDLKTAPEPPLEPARAAAGSPRPDGWRAW